ncbi:hypothetical protein LTR85_000364 [Meristemomyces frigidus]|nr:hypothetical protein LTR85_000364 [Meristemomyces frigidus]
MSRASSTARKALQHHVTAQPKPAFKPQQLLTFRYEPFPGRFNCTTLKPTTDYDADHAHPFHTRTKRKLDAFDATKLHWRVQCPTDVSSKSFIRNWAAKRLRNALALRLREEGWDKDGAPLRTLEESGDGGQATGTQKREALSGALLMILQKSDITLTASKEEVWQSARWVLDTVLRQRQEALRGKLSRTARSSPNSSFDRPVPAPSPSGGAQSLRSNIRKTTAIGPAPPAPAAPKPPVAEALDDRADPLAIRKQVEYYFSDTNLPHDTFMLSLTGGVANQPVSLRTICSFKRMSGCSYAAVVEAIGSSKRLQLINVDGAEAVRRRVPIDARQFGSRTRQNLT